jgi:hypothetical protein
MTAQILAFPIRNENERIMVVASVAIGMHCTTTQAAYRFIRDLWLDGMISREIAAALFLRHDIPVKWHDKPEGAA